MLQYSLAQILYNEIKTKAEVCADSEFGEFYREFLESAVEYASNRAAWAFMSVQERGADDASRSIRHDAYMSMLSAVCRNLGIEGIDEIMPDRKTKGDLACYIALFLALEQR